MKTIKVTSFIAPDGLAVVDTQEPKAGAGQVTIRTQTAGVGTVDILARKGLYPGYNQPGFTPGVEVAGTVIAAADNEHRDWLGKRVFAITRLGGYAEQVTVDANALVPIPDELSVYDAVGLGVNALVAAFSLERASFREGEHILVRGAGGGIGTSTVLYAMTKGAQVTAVASSPEKERQLRSLGITAFISGKPVADVSGSYDIIIDPVAGADIGDFAQMLKENGRYLINGAAGGFPDAGFGSAFLPLFQRSPSILFLSLKTITASSIRRQLELIFQMAVEGKLKPVIDHVFPLVDALQAHQRLESGKVFGKILLDIQV